MREEKEKTDVAFPSFGFHPWPGEAEVEAGWFRQCHLIVLRLLLKVKH